MDTPKILRLAGCGCGSRTRTYLSLASQLPEQFTITAGADPRAERVEDVRRFSGREDFQAFDSADALLDAPKLADVMIIGTQDQYHFEPARRALEKGYDILLEKPIATQLDHVIALHDLAQKLGRRVLVCYVLRYSPFYRKVKELLDGGAIGQIISFNATEGVIPWHQAHSFVRGHWSRSEDSSPMIIAKSCHDLDILPWLMGAKVKRVSSAGGLEFFHARHKPEGAPLRCTDGCPVGDTCPYNAKRYASEHREWLAMVYDRARVAPEEEILTWLETSPWGRCVFQCDNDVVDHQTVNMEFENGMTGTFTMTAFDQTRHLEVYGTEGVLRGGRFYKTHAEGEIIILPHHGGEIQKIMVETPHGGYGGHGGGDYGLVQDLYRQMTCPMEEMETSISEAVHSHVIGFSAEFARINHVVVDLDESLKP